MADNKIPPPTRAPANQSLRNSYILGALLIILGIIGMVYIGVSLTMTKSNLSPAANSPTAKE